MKRSSISKIKDIAALTAVVLLSAVVGQARADGSPAAFNAAIKAAVASGCSLEVEVSNPSASFTYVKGGKWRGGQTSSTERDTEVRVMSRGNGGCSIARTEITAVTALQRIPGSSVAGIKTSHRDGWFPVLWGVMAIGAIDHAGGRLADGRIKLAHGAYCGVLSECTLTDYSKSYVADITDAYNQGYGQRPRFPDSGKSVLFSDQPKARVVSEIHRGAALMYPPLVMQYEATDKFLVGFDRPDLVGTLWFKVRAYAGAGPYNAATQEIDDDMVAEGEDLSGSITFTVTAS